MHTIKITPNLLFEYQCTSGKFIRLPNRIESKNRFGSENRIKSNRNFFLPELDCSSDESRRLLSQAGYWTISIARRYRRAKGTFTSHELK